MTPQMNKTEGLPNGAEPDATQRIRVDAAEQLETPEPQETRTVFGSLRDAYGRARDGRKRVQPEKQSRTAKSVDRSKGLLLQMADSGAVDRPALAPIGFGISSLRKKGAE